MSMSQICEEKAEGEQIMVNTIFISGATGNMGKEVVKQLVSKGAQVRAGVHSHEKAGILRRNTV